MAKVDLLSLGIKPQYTFDQLVVGSHNQMAAAASLQVSRNLGDAYNPLFIFGPTGVGKTHLMQSIGHAVLQQTPDIKLKYVSSERFVNEVISAISEDNLLGFRQHYNQLSLLLVDDLQFLMESKSAQSEFLHIFNNMHQENHQVVLTADRSPHELESFDKAIRSRLEWGLSTDVKLPDPLTRIEILKLKQKNYGLNLSEEALKYVSDILASNVRELEGFLKRLHAYVTLSHQPVNMGLIKSVVFEIQPNPANAASASKYIPTGPLMAPIVASAMVVSMPEPEIEKSIVPAEIQVVIPKSEVPLPSESTSTYSNGHAEPYSIPLTPPPQPPIASTPPIFSQAVPAQIEPLDVASFQKPALAPVAAPPSKLDIKKQPVIPPEIVSTPPPVVVPVPDIALAKVEIPVIKEPPVADPVPVAPIEVALVEVPVVDISTDFDSEPLPPGHKEVAAAFFFPIGCEKQLESVIRKFQEVIKKHKLKFRLKQAVNHGYEYKGKINYSSFVEVCRTNKVPVAIVIGPPSEGGLTDQEFYDLLSVTLDVQGVSLQLVAWNEIDKDYRYLNLALDIALVRMR